MNVMAKAKSMRLWKSVFIREILVYLFWTPMAVAMVTKPSKHMKGIALITSKLSLPVSRC